MFSTPPNIGNLQRNLHFTTAVVEQEDGMDAQKPLHDRLDEELDFIRKLKLAAQEGELVLWTDRLRPPNLEVDEFKIFLSKVRGLLSVDFVSRVSKRLVF